MVVHTSNKGGQSVTKRFRVSTNDPQANLTQLEVTGKVEALIEISPERIRISGYRGDDLSQKVEFKPINDHLFTIKEVKAGRGESGITWDLKPLSKTSPPKGYVLTVSCGQEKEGRQFESLMVHTDLEEKPVIRIPVSCYVLTKPDEIQKTPKKEQVSTP